MPLPVSTSLLALGAILTSADATAGIFVAAGGVAIEGVRFYLSGADGR